MSDIIAKRGRPRVPILPKLSCLKNKREPNSYGFMNDNTIWHKNMDSCLGLDMEKAKDNYNKRSVLLKRDLVQNKKWRTINDITLTEDDKTILVRDEWLSDSIVNASQTLLQREYPHIRGLQNVLLSEINLDTIVDSNIIPRLEESQRLWITNQSIDIKHIEKTNELLKKAETETELSMLKQQLVQYKEDLKKCEQKLSQIESQRVKVEGLQPLESNSKFVQIMLDKSTGNQFHWICVSNITTNDFKTVRIFDSDLKRIDYSIQNYSVYIKNIFRRLFGSQTIRIELPLVSQSSDNCSGGVYAIAFAQALCEGSDPSDILFSTVPQVMRSHLLKCLEMGSFSPFPTARDHKLANYTIHRPLNRQNKQKN